MTALNFYFLAIGLGGPRNARDASRVNQAGQEPAPQQEGLASPVAEVFDLGEGLRLDEFEVEVKSFAGKLSDLTQEFPKVPWDTTEHGTAYPDMPWEPKESFRAVAAWNAAH